MTATYELRIKDRNLDIPVIGGNGRHTGFELVIKDGDNIRIQVVELLQDPASDNIVFNITEYDGKSYTLADGKQVVWADQNLLTDSSNKVFVPTETSAEQLSGWHVKTTTLDVDNPLEIFNKIKLEAELMNANPNKVAYELFDKNCNTFTQAMCDEYIPGINIKDELNRGYPRDKQYPYAGIDKDFYDCENPADKNPVSAGNVINDIIESQGGNLTDGFPNFTWEDDKIHFQYNGKDYTVNGGNSPIYNTQDNTNIFSGNGADKISNSGSGNTINGSNGSDHIIDTGGAVIDLGPINPPTNPGNPQPPARPENNDTVEANPGSGKQTEIRGAGENDIIKTDQDVTDVQREGDDLRITLGNGTDRIIAGDGNDTLIGGLGNDNLNGDAGDDTYVWNLGDGLDKIYDTKGSDVLKFGPGIAFSDLKFTFLDAKGGASLLKSVKISVKNDPNQGLILDGQLYQDGISEYGIRYLEFSDGSRVDLKTFGLEMDMFEGVTNGRGTIYDDILYAHDTGGDISALAGNDIIYGGNGTDRIIAGDGNDTLVGGLGNDNLEGDAGDDTYVWNLGDGLDKIYDTKGSDVLKFGPGIAFSDLKFTFLDAKGGASLLKSVKISVKNDPNQGLILDGQLYQDGISEYGIRYLEFSDGSRVDLKTFGLEMDMFEGVTNGRGTIYDDILYAHDTGGDISALAGNDIIYGGNGTDRIIAGDGNDTLVGGRGNDNLYGGEGDDTYVYNLGDGFDTISESGGNDKIVFGGGITQSNLSFEKIGNNLKISINGDEVKGIQINSQFNSSAGNKIETIEFHDGSTLDISNADQLIQAMSTFGVAQGASDNSLSNPTRDVSEMYNLTVNNGITKKAV